MKIIIGLIGAKKAGKTTALEFIAEKYGDKVTEITLASKLKDVCASVFRVEREWFDSHKHKEKDLASPAYFAEETVRSLFQGYDINELDYDKFIRPHIGKILYTPRQIAQYVGTEVLRNYEDGIHCKAAVLGKTGEIGVVTDIRFPNEMEFFKENYPNFYPLYIKNTGAEVEASKDTHVSEAHLKTLAAKLVKVSNDSTLSAFKDELLNVVIDLVEFKNA